LAAKPSAADWRAVFFNVPSLRELAWQYYRQQSHTSSEICLFLVGLGIISEDYTAYQNELLLWWWATVPRKSELIYVLFYRSDLEPAIKEHIEQRSDISWPHFRLVYNIWLEKTKHLHREELIPYRLLLRASDCGKSRRRICRLIEQLVVLT
jgi:hypothetical protein